MLSSRVPHRLRIGFAFVLLSALWSHAAAAEREVDEKNGIYRVGSASSKLALLPTKCGRDLDTALCASIDETLATHLARDPRMEILSPKDLEVLVGAQQLVEMNDCEGGGCFDPAAFTRVEATYLLATAISRIGGDATITIRLIDLKRGVVIDRDDARAWRGSESGIDEATRALATTILVRRGVATPPKEVVDDAGGNPLAFWSGATLTTIGGLGVAAGAFAGGLAIGQVNSLQTQPGLTAAQLEQGSNTARNYGYISDLGMVAGGALAVAGVTMMIVGSF